MRTVSTGKKSESPEPLCEPWRTEGGAEQKTGKARILVISAYGGLRG